MLLFICLVYLTVFPKTINDPTISNNIRLTNNTWFIIPVDHLFMQAKCKNCIACLTQSFNQSAICNDIRTTAKSNHFLKQFKILLSVQNPLIKVVKVIASGAKTLLKMLPKTKKPSEILPILQKATIQKCLVKSNQASTQLS